MSRLWPISESAQADYEALRAAALAGAPLLGVASARFAAAGLVGLIRRPVAEPAFVAAVVGARRASWTPYGDPRLDTLADAYELILATTAVANSQAEEAGA